MNKKNILKYVLALELVVFAILYYRGAHGLQVVYALQRENKLIEQEIENKKMEIATLENEIKTWQSDPFYKEKLAREQLHMARENEEIYLT